MPKQKLKILRNQLRWKPVEKTRTTSNNDKDIVKRDSSASLVTNQDNKEDDDDRIKNDYEQQAQK